MKSKPALVLCLRADDPWGARSGVYLEEGFCKICGHVIRFDPELAKEIRRKYAGQEVQRICLECGVMKLKSDDKPEIDLGTTAEYLRRRFSQ